MSEHTKEPWPSIECYSTGSVRLDKADYIRAKLCVDACAGIKQERLDEMQQKGLTFEDLMRTTMEQRDTAQGELRNIRASIGANPEESTLDEVRRVVSLLNLSSAAERVWETTMMQAVGEDGPADVVKAIEAIKQQRDELMAQQWQPIETAPKSTADGHHIHGVYILGYCPDPDACNLESCVCVVWWEPLMNGGNGMWFGEGSFEVHPTHWMPLPAAPAIASVKGGA